MNYRILAFCALIACLQAVRAQVLTDCDSMASRADWCEEVENKPPSAASMRHDAPKTTTREWLWGIGRANILDTYLSPLTYKGTDFSLLHRTERLAHWGRGRVKVKSQYDGHVSYAKSPTDDGKAFDAELTASGGWLYDWHFSRWSVGVGGLMEASGGFTYNTRNSNNPAQARLGVSLLALGKVTYRFPMFRREAVASVEMSGQAMGVQFAPEYGQSYYEIFSLGHTNGIIHFTHPANCPSGRLLATLTLPILRANVTLGYIADVRQSKLAGLKRHAWRNSFMIGYTRHFKRL